ncbi:YkvA family protein [Thermaurantiacus sp.]
MGWLERVGHRLKRDAHLLWIAARDQRTPVPAKIVGGLVAAYAFSPIDLVPDFVPLLGILDDLLLVPLGLALALALIPRPLAAEFRAAAETAAERPVSRTGAVLVVLTWAAILGLVAIQLVGVRFW